MIHLIHLANQIHNAFLLVISKKLRQEGRRSCRYANFTAVAIHLTIASMVATSLFTGVNVAEAQNWPQFQGPNRNNKSEETGLMPAWPESGPPLAWMIKTAGLGYSSPSIVDDRAYLTGVRSGKTELFCINATDGKELWSFTLSEKAFDFEGNAWGPGPRSAPTVHDGYVYAMAGGGRLVCVNLEGKHVWEKHMIKDLGGSIKNVDAGEPKVLGWGYSWGPIIHGKHLICTPGSSEGQGLVVALDKETGGVIWRSSELNEESTYASPIVASIGGTKQYVVMTQFGIASVSAVDGSLLWKYERTYPYSDVVIPTPVCHGDLVYASTGDGCDLIKITKSDTGTFMVKNVYTSRNMKNSIGGFVLNDGYLYGTSERRGWVCQNFMNGDLAWYKRASESIGDGSLVFAGNQLYLYGEVTAEVSLIDASSEGWKEKGRFSLPAKSEYTPPSGKNWTRPVIAGGKLYLRDQELLFCYDLKANVK